MDIISDKTEHFEDKVIGFVDILGFKNLVHESEEGKGFSISELRELQQLLGTEKIRENFTKIGPLTCPESLHFAKDLNFQLTQVSDCVVVSAELSPAGVINLIDHCRVVALNLLQKGVMCRGYIKRGKIFHDGFNLFGSGYQDAFEKERGVSIFKSEADEKGTPFIEVDVEITKFVKDSNDRCVRDMFSSFTKTDGELTAVFPFQQLTHSFIVADYTGRRFDPAIEKKSNNNLRKLLRSMKAKVEVLAGSSSSAISKSNHYIRMLDQQLIQCDELDKTIDGYAEDYPNMRATRKNFPGIFE